MKKILFAAAFALFASTQAFAIIGIGAHYVLNAGATLKGDNEVVKSYQTAKINLNREEVSGLQGLGLKLWLDFLPVIDIEGTFNVSATRYNPYLEFSETGKRIYLEYEPEAPYNAAFDKASPIYGLFSVDVSVTYPITSLPVIRPYAGAGFSYMAGIPLVDKKFAEPLVDNVIGANLNFDPNDQNNQKKLKEAFSDALTKTDYTTGVGGHLIVGVRAKLPVVPIAAYANTKYYFGGNTNDKFSQGVVFELGGGFAI